MPRFNGLEDDNKDWFWTDSPWFGFPDLHTIVRSECRTGFKGSKWYQDTESEFWPLKNYKCLFKLKQMKTSPDLFLDIMTLCKRDLAPFSPLQFWLGIGPEVNWSSLLSFISYLIFYNVTFLQSFSTFVHSWASEPKGYMGLPTHCSFKKIGKCN